MRTGRYIRWTALAVSAAVLAVSTGCTAPRRVDTETAPAADFSVRHTFAWQESPASLEPQTASADDEAVERTIRDTVVEQLSLKGFREVQGAEPDFLVSFHLVVTLMTEPELCVTRHLIFNYQPDDLRLIERSRQLLHELFDRVGATDREEIEITWSRHHQGTCRMGADPRTSVCDPNLRIHDCPNLYLVGCETFVTGAAVPPTLTIVALAHRLGDHLLARGQQVTQGGRGIELGLKPPAGAAMQVAAAGLIQAGGALAQETGKQRVVAKPATLVIQREQEQAGALDVVEHALRAGLAGDGFA